MRKLFIWGIGIALLLVGQTLMAQHCYFYSLKYVRVGQENVKPPFAAGMYVTFPAGKDGKYICYDSDRDGYATDASYKLDYVGSNRNACSYYGWTYWGQAYYNFSTDYSLLNVIDELGNVYVFNRANGTQSQSTYYSVTDSRNNPNDRGGGGTVIISGNSHPSGTSSSGGKTKRIVRVKCSYCNGTGISWSEKVYLPNYTGADERQWCSKCNAWGIPHKHIDHRCTVCRNGYIEKEE